MLAWLFGLISTVIGTAIMFQIFAMLGALLDVIVCFILEAI